MDEELERATQELADTWADGMDARLFGVDLADVMEYDLLQIINQLVAQGGGHE